MSQKQQQHLSDYNIFVCNTCSETIAVNHSYTHTASECRDILLSKIEKLLDKAPLFILNKIYNLLLSTSL